MAANPLTSKAVGDRWEKAAEAFLRRNGLTTLTRNFRCQVGEIDLVMRDASCLVFIEVRYRNHPHFGSGADSITTTKQRRIIRAAHRYLQMHGGRVLPPCRFDVVSMKHLGGQLRVEWIRDAFCDE